MPTLYEYLGIIIRIYLGDHKPIHVHAICGENEMRIVLHEKDGVVCDVEYISMKGKFTPAQKRNLAAFIEEKKSVILFVWEQSQRQEGLKFKPTKITKRIKNDKKG
jgi:hypothetical protein